MRIGKQAEKSTINKRFQYDTEFCLKSEFCLKNEFEHQDGVSAQDGFLGHFLPGDLIDAGGPEISIKVMHFRPIAAVERPAWMPQLQPTLQPFATHAIFCTSVTYSCCQRFRTPRLEIDVCRPVMFPEAG
jgi:hypothetical protein